jgi:DNA polymerase-3 subunit delta'
MQFSDVIGQSTVKAHLADMVKQNRLSHALLFLGKEGTGGLPLAIAFSQYILCEKVIGKPGQSGTSLFGDVEPVSVETPSEACGICNSCKKAAELVHPDIHFSYPVVPKKPGDKPVSTDYASEWREFIKESPYGNVYDWLQFIGAENKQGNITSQECNDIIRKLSLKSFESEYKILVMWMPEYLGNEGNKLLKLIEEPPANTLFILVAESETLILQTVLSRTQLVKLPPIEIADIQQTLIERGKLTADQARQIASVSGGNYREAVQLLQHAGEDWQSLLREWLNSIMKSGPIAQVKWIEEISKQGREKQKQFLRYFNHLLEVAVKMQVMPGYDLAFAENEKDFAARLNKMVGIEQQQAIIEELDKASYYIERNANAKMLFHALTIRLYHIIADKSLILTG